jgi:hypothetical protein
MKNIAITLIFLLFIIAHFSYAQISFFPAVQDLQS